MLTWFNQKYGKNNAMLCPYCGASTQVVNSRPQRRSNQVWRRRHCPNCQAVFTSHEAVHMPSVFVIETGHGQAAFKPEHLVSELLECLRDHERAYEATHELSAAILQKVTKKALNGTIMASDVSLETARTLKRFDRRAYLRFIAEHPSLQA